ncbi:hypothetical protein ANCCAN_29406 [Ancylostoma caninum]|uniref:Fibronectin type-III domain-containing protein n=1 Tax=Ancylostoma caninum TaxID=29170 RepID=A0A368EZS3_ANCCA|nr:hypothetical protein ANCCAN_29406 [Ancylostoma caninum]
MITGYRIFYTNNDRSSPVESWESQETKSDELMATLYGLETEKRYYIVVQARNAQGTSPMSSVVTVATKHGSKLSFHVESPFSWEFHWPTRPTELYERTSLSLDI